jgi:wyosine [tRNA(Phe)-imidazoG37] synthetase (radical SAM superfamily)
MYNYIFGPVVSRRLGLSLGIDLVPMKTCSFDCVYCECGATTELTIERKEYVPTDDVCREIGQFMQNTSQKVDYITFSGSGEPTLHTGIERVIGYIKQNFPKQKIALLTNATLFNDKKVRDGVLDCDLIVPSLDAISPSVFERILGPHPSVTSGTVLEGIISLRKESLNY